MPPTSGVRATMDKTGFWIASVAGCHFTHGAGTTAFEAVRDLADRLWMYYERDVRDEGAQDSE